MVLLLMTGVMEEESADATLEFPEILKPESVQSVIWEVLQVMVTVLPLSTRPGLAVNVLIAPASTQLVPFGS
jgi:hypothetical protein